MEDARADTTERNGLRTAPIIFLTACAAARADIDPVSGIDLVTIGATNNAAWAGDGTPNDQSIGRGSVGYEYRIGKFEITTAQYVEFLNAAFDRPPGGLDPEPLRPRRRWLCCRSDHPQHPWG